MIVTNAPTSRIQQAELRNEHGINGQVFDNACLNLFESTYLSLISCMV